jgi:hypothetical protein
MKYCGGDSDIIYLLKGYHDGYVPALGIDLNERMMDRIATIVQPLAPAVTDVTVLPTQLDAILATMLAEIHAARPMEFVKKQSERFGRSGRSSGGDGQDHWSCTDDYYFWPSNG